MLTLLALCAGAFAGEIVMNTEVAASLVIDGAVVVEALTPATVRVPVADGEHRVVVRTGKGTVELGRILLQGGLRLSVDSGGLASWDKPELVTAAGQESPTVDPSAPITVEFRSPGNMRLMVLLGKERFFVGPGEVVTRSLAAGAWSLGLRSADGTNIFARGMLIVPAGVGAQVVELVEGSLPRPVGEDLQFAAEGR